MSEKRPGYVIVRGASCNQLEIYVNNAIKDGYIPVGGPIVTFSPDATRNGEIVQAMVLHDLWKHK